jgi:DNA-binding GntR family transcriptional regulator
MRLLGYVVGPKPIKIDLTEKYKLADQVYAHLRAMILKGEIRVGVRLFETEVAEQFGVSRSPVREAIKRLEQEGLVVVDRLRVIVREIPESEIKDLLWVRCALEGMAAWLATPRLTDHDLRCMENLCDRLAAAQNDPATHDDFELHARIGDEFHSVFHGACGNQKLLDMLAEVKEYISRYRGVSAGRPGRGPQSLQEHREIYDAFRLRDPDLAEARLKTHIVRGMRLLFSQDMVGTEHQFLPTEKAIQQVMGMGAVKGIKN